MAQPRPGTVPHQRIPRRAGLGDFAVQGLEETEGEQAAARCRRRGLTGDGRGGGDEPLVFEEKLAIALGRLADVGHGLLRLADLHVDHVVARVRHDDAEARALAAQFVDDPAEIDGLGRVVVEVEVRPAGLLRGRAEAVARVVEQDHVVGPGGQRTHRIDHVPGGEIAPLVDPVVEGQAGGLDDLLHLLAHETEVAGHHGPDVPVVGVDDEQGMERRRPRRRRPHGRRDDDGQHPESAKERANEHHHTP